LLVLTLKTSVREKVKIGIEEALNKAILVQKNEAIKYASEIYAAILRELPNRADAKHNMGVLSATIGNPDEAVRFFDIALKTNPNAQQYWLSYINLVIELNRMNEEQKLYEKAENIGVT
jgi:tetratricopeptide (TPR) repeat protein